jgi:hypothetical protein
LCGRRRSGGSTLRSVRRDRSGFRALSKMARPPVSVRAIGELRKARGVTRGTKSPKSVSVDLSVVTLATLEVTLLPARLPIVASFGEVVSAPA